MIIIERKEDLRSILEKFVPIGRVLHSFDNTPTHGNTYKIWTTILDERNYPEEQVPVSFEIDFEEEFLTQAGYHFKLEDIVEDISAFMHTGKHFSNDLAFSCDTVAALIDTIEALQNKMDLITSPFCRTSSVLGNEGNHAFTINTKALEANGCSSYIEDDVHSAFINSPENDPKLDDLQLVTK